VGLRVEHGAPSLIAQNSGKYESIAEVLGFTRGSEFAREHPPESRVLAFVRLSRVRESAHFSGIPIIERLAEEERTCGVWDSDVQTGQPVALPRFGSAVQEVFVMPGLPGGRCPGLSDDANLPEKSFVPPDKAPLDVPDLPSAGAWATSFLLPPELGRSSHPVRSTGRIGTDSRNARFGPTTPTRASRLFDASVDPTEAS
jgi:hypothetical protein